MANSANTINLQEFHSPPLLKMKTIMVLVFVASLASDLCNARKSRKPGKHKKEKDRADKDKELIKSLIPKNLGEFFDLAEKIVPGTKDLRTRNEKSWKLLHSVLKVNLTFCIII